MPEAAFQEHVAKRVLAIGQPHPVELVGGAFLEELNIVPPADSVASENYPNPHHRNGAVDAAYCPPKPAVAVARQVAVTPDAESGVLADCPSL